MDIRSRWRARQESIGRRWRFTTTGRGLRRFRRNSRTKLTGEAEPSAVKFATFYYPGFYSCPLRNAAAGKIVDEWKLLEELTVSPFIETPRIEPALGHTASSDPRALAEEARLAVLHGVDAFIFNHYSDGQREELGVPITTFSGLDTDLKFALNICCHMPKRKVPFGVQDTGVTELARLSEAAFTALAQDLTVRFVNHPRYLRHQGRAVLTMYHVNAMVLLYGPRGLKARLDILRRILRSHGHEAYIVGLYSVVGSWSRRTPGIDELPFDAFSCYVALPDFESQQPVQPFDLAAGRTLQAMQERPESGTAIVACVGAGWNATARGAAGYDPDRDGLAFPYYPVVVGDEPAAFERFLREAARAALDRPGFNRDLLFLGPWNEWTEGCYLLPDMRHGLGKLEAIRRVKEDLAASGGNGKILSGREKPVGRDPANIVASEQCDQFGQEPKILRREPLMVRENADRSIPSRPLPSKT